MELYIVQKQGRDENMQEDYPTTERWQKRLYIPYMYIYMIRSRYHADSVLVFLFCHNSLVG